MSLAEREPRAALVRRGAAQLERVVEEEPVQRAAARIRVAALVAHEAVRRAVEVVRAVGDAVDERREQRALGGEVEVDRRQLLRSS